MTWAKIDDQFPDHPKVVAAGGDAAWLYVAALCYCQAKLTDGHIPAGIVPRLTDRKAPMRLAATLVESRMQRDLTDSSMQRNIGVAFGHSLLAIDNATRGLDGLDAVPAAMLADLRAWALGEVAA